MERLRYTLWRFTVDIIGLFSRVLNAWVFGGSTSQTLSVRAHVEATGGDPSWIKRRDFINTLFFWEEDHCARWWREEVDRARYTLRLMSEHLAGTE